MPSSLRRRDVERTGSISNGSRGSRREAPRWDGGATGARLKKREDNDDFRVFPALAPLAFVGGRVLVWS